MSMGRPELLLVALHELSHGTTEPVQYEDLVVRAWELDKQAFGLRGYAEKYPDSSDAHKPLYGPLKKAGYVTASRKQFQLTPKGITEAARLGRLLKNGDAPPPSFVPRSEMTRDKEREFERLLRTEAFRLHSEGKDEEILDTDFYAYLGITARTPPGEGIGRLRTVQDAVATAVRTKYRVPTSQEMHRLHRFLLKKFKETIPAQEA